MTRPHNLVITVWQDTKTVTMLSTLWDPVDVVKVKKNKKDGSIVEVNCPGAIDTYNKFTDEWTEEIYFTSITNSA